MKCFILLSFLALCHSYPYGSGYGSWLGYGSGKNFNVNQDGSVTITTANGKIITVSKGIDQGNVAVTVTDPINLGSKLYQSYQSYQPTQGDILAQILTQYPGTFNQNTYQQLLDQVYSSVQTGQLTDAVYQALQNLNQNQVGFLPYQTQYNVWGGQQMMPDAQQVQQIQSQGYPYATTEEVVVPVGVNQQGQIVEKIYLQQGVPQTVAYPVTGYQGQSVLGTGSPYFKTLIHSLLSGNGYQNGLYGMYGQVGPAGQIVTGQLSQIMQQEKGILGQQNQIQQGQYQQQLQQGQLLQQQQQLQGQQQYVQQMQQKEQQDQEVLQQQQYNTLKALWNGIKTIQTGQQGGFWQQQQQPGVYSQGGLYGIFGQGIHGHNIPLMAY